VWAAAFVINKHRYATYTLPNGMIVKRKYADWLLTDEYYDISAPDGVTLRVPGVWLISFNDRYLEASGLRREDGGTFDSYDNGRPLSGSDYPAVTGRPEMSVRPGLTPSPSRSGA
jgi:hypothetical protein